MKICPTCGFHSEDDAKMCNNCGEAYSTRKDVEAKSRDNTQVKDFQQSVHEEKSSQKPLLIVLIIICILLLCSMVLLILDNPEGFSAADTAQSEGDSEYTDKNEAALSGEPLTGEREISEGSAETATESFTEKATQKAEVNFSGNLTEGFSESETEEPITQSEVSKTGVISGNAYKNEWAGVSVIAPAGFYVNTAASHQLKDSEGITDAFVCSDSSGNSVMFILYDYSGESVSQESILQMHIDSQVRSYESMGADVSVGEAYRKTIRAYTYTCIDAEIYYDGITYYMTSRLGNYEGHIAMLLFVGDSQEMSAALESGITLP